MLLGEKSLKSEQSLSAEPNTWKDGVLHSEDTLMQRLGIHVSGYLSLDSLATTPFPPLLFHILM